MGYHYQSIDRELLDYQLAPIDPIPDLPLRGPYVDCSKPYAVCLGAAQTFGRFCQLPFATLLSSRLALPIVNLGIGGVGPAFFDQPPFLEVINEAEFVVLQVFSGRSAGNSLFDNSRTRAMLGIRVADGREISSDEFYADLVKEAPPGVVRSVVGETRRNYVAQFVRTLANLSPPCILFWFSQQRPESMPESGSVEEMMGVFPQLVNSRMVEEIRPHCDEYVECVSRRGLPHRVGKLNHEVDGADYENGIVVNRYYPSPEMHIDAANLLEPVCARVLHEKSTGLTSPLKPNGT